MKSNSMTGLRIVVKYLWALSIPFFTTISAEAATVLSVGDGDTIRITTAKGQKVTVRLACIDAPETAQGQSGADAT